MAGDNTVVNLGENSPEQVAFKLLQLVANAEKKQLQSVMSASANSDRKWILDTYVECLQAVKGSRRIA